MGSKKKETVLQVRRKGLFLQHFVGVRSLGGDTDGGIQCKSDTLFASSVLLNLNIILFQLWEGNLNFFCVH